MNDRLNSKFGKDSKGVEQRGDQVRDHETAKALEFWVCITSFMEWIFLAKRMR